MPCIVSQLAYLPGQTEALEQPPFHNGLLHIEGASICGLLRGNCLLQNILQLNKLLPVMLVFEFFVAPAVGLQALTTLACLPQYLLQMFHVGHLPYCPFRCILHFFAISTNAANKSL